MVFSVTETAKVGVTIGKKDVVLRRMQKCGPFSVILKALSAKCLSSDFLFLYNIFVIQN